MNKTNQKKNNTYVNYWSNSGKSAKEANQVLKIANTISYLDKEGKEQTRTIYIQPSLKDIVLKKPVPATTSSTKKPKAERFKNLPYSTLHKKIVADAYGKENKIFKQQAIIAAHENKIDNLIIENKARKFNTTKRNLADCPNLVVIRRLNDKNEPYDFSINPSRGTLDELWKEAKEANVMFSKCMKNYFGITIWERAEYMNKGNYRYCVYALKDDAKLAA